MENRIKRKLQQLYEIEKLYSDLEKKASGHYKWRLDAVQIQIDILLDLQNDTDDMYNQWLECYREDLQEAIKEGYIKR